MLSVQASSVAVKVFELNPIAQNLQKLVEAFVWFCIAKQFFFGCLPKFLIDNAEFVSFGDDMFVILENQFWPARECNRGKAIGCYLKFLSQFFVVAIFACFFSTHFQNSIPLNFPIKNKQSLNSFFPDQKNVSHTLGRFFRQTNPRVWLDFIGQLNYKGQIRDLIWFSLSKHLLKPTSSHNNFAIRLAVGGSSAVAGTTSCKVCWRVLKIIRKWSRDEMVSFLTDKTNGPIVGSFAKKLWCSRPMKNLR